MISNDKLEDLLKQMYAQEDETIDTSDIIDEEWQKFESEHFAPKHHSWGWMQIAAAFIGLLMLSGIAYATIHIFSSSHSQQAVENQGDRSLDSIQNHGPVPLILQVAHEDQTPIEPKTFENIPLKDLVVELAKAYHISLEIRNDKTAALRLYYPWNPQMSLQQVVEELNRFEKVQLTLTNDKLIIE